MYKIRFKNVMRLLLFALLLFPSIGIVSQNNAGRFHDTKLTFDSKYLPTLKPDIIKELESVYYNSEFIKLVNDTTPYYFANTRFYLNYTYSLHELDNVINSCKYIEPDTSLPYKFNIRYYPQFYGMLNLVSKKLLIYTADSNELFINVQFDRKVTTCHYKEDSMKMTTSEDYYSIIISGKDTIYKSKERYKSFVFPEKWRPRVAKNPHLKEFKRFQYSNSPKNNWYLLTLGNITTKYFDDNSREALSEKHYEIVKNGTVIKVFRNLYHYFESMKELKKKYFREIQFTEEMAVQDRFIQYDESLYLEPFIEIIGNKCSNYYILSKKKYLKVFVPKDINLLKKIDVIKLLDPSGEEYWVDFLKYNKIKTDAYCNYQPLWKIDTSRNMFYYGILSAFQDSNCYLSLFIDSVLDNSNLKNNKIKLNDKIRGPFQNYNGAGSNYMVFKKTNDGFKLVYFYNNGWVPNTTQVKNKLEEIKLEHRDYKKLATYENFYFQGYSIIVGNKYFKHTKYRIGKIFGSEMDSILLKKNKHVKKSKYNHIDLASKYTVVALKHAKYGWMLYQNQKPIKGINANWVCSNFGTNSKTKTQSWENNLNLWNIKDSTGLSIWRNEEDYGISTTFRGKTTSSYFTKYADTQVLETKQIKTKTETTEIYLYKNKPFSGEIWTFNIPVVYYGYGSYNRLDKFSDTLSDLINNNFKSLLENNTIKLFKYQSSNIYVTIQPDYKASVNLNQLKFSDFASISSFKDGKYIGNKSYNLFKEEIHTKLNPDTSAGKIQYTDQLFPKIYYFKSESDFYAYYFKKYPFTDSVLFKQKDSLSYKVSKTKLIRDSWNISTTEKHFNNGSLFSKIYVQDKINATYTKIRTYAIANGTITDSSEIVVSDSHCRGEMIVAPYNQKNFYKDYLNQKDSFIQYYRLAKNKDTLWLVFTKSMPIQKSNLIDFLDQINDVGNSYGNRNPSLIHHPISDDNYENKSIEYFLNRRAIARSSNVISQYNYPMGKTYFFLDSTKVCALCDSVWEYNYKEKKYKLVFKDIKSFKYAFLYPNGKAMGKTVFYNSIEKLNTAVDCKDTIFPVARYPLEFTEFYNEQGIKTFDGKNGSVILKDNYGQLMYEKHYKNGQLDSVSKTFSGSGKLTEIGNYKNGKKHGVWLSGDLSLEFDWAKLCGETLEKIKLYQSRMNLMIQAEEYVEGKLIQSKLLQFNIEK